jgi:hypothetical protein
MNSLANNKEKINLMQIYYSSLSWMKNKLNDEIERNEAKMLKITIVNFST